MTTVIRTLPTENATQRLEQQHQQQIQLQQQTPSPAQPLTLNVQQEDQFVENGRFQNPVQVVPQSRPTEVPFLVANVKAPKQLKSQNLENNIPVVAQKSFSGL